MVQVMRMIAVVMLVVAVATTGYAQSGAMAPEQMKMMSGQMKTMSDQMKGGKMTPDQMGMMGGRRQVMGGRGRGPPRGQRGSGFRSPHIESGPGTAWGAAVQPSRPARRMAPSVARPCRRARSVCLRTPRAVRRVAGGTGAAA